MAGFSPSIDRLAQLPDRFPNRFQLTANGLLSVASSDHDPGDEDLLEDPPSPDWYRPNARRAELDRVAVLDIETTGLDPAKDFIWEIALVRIDGEPLVHLPVQLPSGVPRPNDEDLDTAVPLDEALRSLATHLDAVDLVVGHNLVAFDLPFLETAAKRAGLEPVKMPPSADSLHLATLVDVSMPNRSLADLAFRFGIERQAAHRAQDDAITTAAVVRALLDEVDMTEPSWPLAIGILESFDDPLVSLLPALSSPPQIDTLNREPDPLLVHSGAPATDASSATRDAFRTLKEQRGLRSRASQLEMAHAVAEVFDHGGNLAVEAPTGTGKSLAYLLPALGRASRRGQPVVVATATKALQSQLREEAARLQEGGLLRAPFRQIQGVGNYVCARELEDALPDRESSGLALAVAVRALATSPTGTWDDVTDDVIRRRDSRYATHPRALADELWRMRPDARCTLGTRVPADAAAPRPRQDARRRVGQPRAHRQLGQDRTRRRPGPGQRAYRSRARTSSSTRLTRSRTP